MSLTIVGGASSNFLWPVCLVVGSRTLEDGLRTALGRHGLTLLRAFHLHDVPRKDSGNSNGRVVMVLEEGWLCNTTIWRVELILV